MILRVGGKAGFLAAVLMLAPLTASAGDGTFGVPPSGILLPPPPAPAKVTPAKATPAKVTPARPMPARTAALIPPENAAPEKQRSVQRVQQTYQPAPAEGAGGSRPLPPSQAPVHSPVIAPPKHKRFKAPTASVDPDYVASVAQGEPRSLSAPAPAAAPVVAQGAAPEQKRGLFNMLRGRNAGVQTAQVQTQVQAAPSQTAPVQLAPAAYTTSAASAAYAEHTAAPAQPASAQPAPATSRLANLFSFGGGGKASTHARDGTPCSQLRGIFTSPPECR